MDKIHKGKNNGLKQQSISEIVEEVKDSICADYCKYRSQCIEQLNQEDFEDRYCDTCPLNRL